MPVAEILKIDPLPTSYEELVELMREPLRREDPVRYALEAMWSLRNAILKELAHAHNAERIEALKQLYAATLTPKKRGKQALASIH
jgi:hypothetical protein